MTDRIHTLTVVLEKDMREDDAEFLINAIQQLRGVLCVNGHVSTAQSYMAEERAMHALRKKLWAALYPDEEQR